MAVHTWPDVLTRLLNRGELPGEEARWAMDELLSGRASQAQIAAFLTALSGKGVTGAELAHFVEVMLEHAVAVDVPGLAVDTCGTGGDFSGTVNISTLAAVVAAACGVPVVKHGNRSATSKSGSADMLEALGMSLAVPPERVVDCLTGAGIAFCFAGVFHPAMRHITPVRRDLGIRTVFNLMGPLANPARPHAQVLGVADEAMAPVVADALARRGTAAFVVRGEDGLDEITTMAPTRVWDCRRAQVRTAVLDARELGIERPALGALSGGDPARNAELARAAFTPGADPAVDPMRDAVALNAAAALLLFEGLNAPQSDSRASAGHRVPNGAESPHSDDLGLVEQLRPHLATARAAIAGGDALRQLDRWVAVSRTLLV